MPSSLPPRVEIPFIPFLSARKRSAGNLRIRHRSRYPATGYSLYFQRFFQSPHSGSKEGTGIGLYLVKTYTELHGGSINGVTSEKGKGTSIGLSIPVTAVEEDEIPAAQSKKQLESLPVLKPIEAESQDEKFLSNIIRLIEDHSPMQT